MLEPDTFLRRYCALCVVSVLLILPFLFGACSGTAVSTTEAKAKPLAPAKEVHTSMPMWLGNSARAFYGTGPWSDRPLAVIWEFETELTSGRLHKDGWGGSSWPGQPSVSKDYVV